MDHVTNEHLRTTACRRVREGEKPSAVMKSMGLCRTTIYKWLRTYRRQGEAGLARRKATGRKPRLNARQRQAVIRWIVGKDPRQYGFDFGLWTRRIVSEMIGKKFGIRLQVTAVGHLLASLNITPQKPLRRAYERDLERIAAWRKTEFPRIRTRARRRGAKIYFLDEAGVRSDAPLGRTYGLKGKTPEVRTSGQRQSVNAISTVNLRGAFWHSVYTGRLHAHRFIRLLKAFRRKRARMIVILDSHPAHVAKKVAAYVQSTRGELEIYFLPPYAPDLNPDEFVWNHLRQKGVSKKPLRQNESLKKRVQKDLRSIGAQPALVRAFFKAQSVAYITD